MRKVFDFNQIDFLADIMDIDGWESALHEGSCTAMSAYFVKLALAGASISDISQRFDDNKANIAELQQEGVNRHDEGWDGYGYLLGQIGLSWSGGVYSDPKGHFSGGQCALCLIKFGDGTAHTIAFLFHKNENIIYMFDPNLGLYVFDPAAWYNTEFGAFMQSNYPNSISFEINNVA